MILNRNYRVKEIVNYLKIKIFVSGLNKFRRKLSSNILYFSSINNLISLKFSASFGHLQERLI
jgi:hypothetical protein